MAHVIYVLCALTASLCAFLLLRGYAASRARLLLWGGLCFIGLAINNIVLIVDRMVLPGVDLTLVRMIPAIAGVSALLYGLIWEAE
jgi:hypothetical protein